MKLRDYQINVLNDRAPRILVGAARRVGKDTMVIELLKQANMKESVVFFPNEGLLKAFINGITPHVFTIDTKSDARVKFRDGSPWIQLRVVTENTDIRGFQGSRWEKAIIYEPAYFKNEKFLLDIMNLQVGMPNARLYYIGTPKKSPKERYDAFTMLHKFRDEFQLSYHNIDASKMVQAEYLEKASQELTKDKYETDVLAQFS